MLANLWRTVIEVTRWLECNQEIQCPVPDIFQALWLRIERCSTHPWMTSDPNKIYRTVESPHISEKRIVCNLVCTCTLILQCVEIESKSNGSYQDEQMTIVSRVVKAVWVQLRQAALKTKSGLGETAGNDYGSFKSLCKETNITNTSALLRREWCRYLKPAAAQISGLSIAQ